MTIHYWSVEGYGYDANIIDDISLKKKFDFIKKYLPFAFKVMLKICEFPETATNDLLDIPENADAFIKYLNDYEDDYGNTGNFAIFVGEAINNHEDGFDVRYVFNEFGEKALMYFNRAPFEVSERVRNMTKGEMRDVFAKYLRDLDIDAEFIENGFDNHSFY